MSKVILVAMAIGATVACRETDRPSVDVPGVDVNEAAFSDDAGNLVPASCPGPNQHVPEVTAFDPARGCPTAITVGHPYSGPGVCDTVEACCNFPAACAFDTTVTLSIRGSCGGLEFLPQRTDLRSGCRCAGGRVVCPGYEGAIGNACLDCFIGSGRDGGTSARPDVPRFDLPDTGPGALDAGASDQ